METEAGVQVSALPELKEESQYAAYKRRFDYLLLNLPVLHQPSSLEVRRQLNALYPDSASIQKAYLKKYAQDSVLVHYFEATAAPIDNPNWPKQKHFTEAELMEVSSKFFFCDKVLPDTSIQAHVCIGLNGIKEAEWKEDYTLLEAFCYEVIFTAFDQDSSQLWDTFVAQKREAIAQLRTEINSLEEYLDNVKKALFKRMESSEVLKQELLHYYRLNKSNLAFDIREQ
ncbi:MAG: hypothetical protein EP332_02895 [Bacteroidetes bacterium]|nr:MAG: hypothetical protein EP332_02895 [Bacteroidota bacterium]